MMVGVSVPANPEWMLQLPEICSRLEELEVPVVDRVILERIFGVSRRRATQLMHSFGGYLAGRTFLIDRSHLISTLHAIKNGAEFAREQSRRERLGARMEQVRRARAGSCVRIPVTPEVLSSRVVGLPCGIALQPGRLLIEFATTEDLLVKLVALAQAAANDFNGFAAATKPHISAVSE